MEKVMQGIFEDQSECESERAEEKNSSDLPQIVVVVAVEVK